MGAPLIYDINMPRHDFIDAVNLVKAVRRGNYNLSDIRLVTQDTSRLTEDQQAYVADDPGALGITFGNFETNLFDVWFTPAISNWRSDFAIDTVLHELCHGLFGCYKHGEQFRRYLGRAMFHYLWLVAPLDAWGQVTTMVARYSRDTPEHQAMEVESLYKASLREYEYVSRKYKELQNATPVVISVA
jgi:hypothetical protein